MARLYANENFPYEVVHLLNEMGHDVLTTRDVGRANLGIPDEDVFAFAIEEKRAVLTINRQDFFKLARQNPDHFGLVACTKNDDVHDFAQKIDAAIRPFGDDLAAQIVRVYLDQKPF